MKTIKLNEDQYKLLLALVNEESLTLQEEIEGAEEYNSTHPSDATRYRLDALRGDSITMDSLLQVLLNQ